MSLKEILNLSDLSYLFGVMSLLSSCNIFVRCLESKSVSIVTSA
jgi:hypothetical protein